MLIASTISEQNSSIIFCSHSTFYDNYSDYDCDYDSNYNNDNKNGKDDT